MNEDLIFYQFIYHPWLMKHLITKLKEAKQNKTTGIFIANLFSSWLSLMSSTDYGCESKWMSRGAFCYHIVTTKVKYDTAKTACEKEDATLTSILSKNESTFLTMLTGRTQLGTSSITGKCSGGGGGLLFPIFPRCDFSSSR